MKKRGRPKKVMNRNTPGYALQRVQFRLTAEKKAEWKVYCAANGLSSQEIFEAYVDNLLAKGDLV